MNIDKQPGTYFLITSHLVYVYKKMLFMYVSKEGTWKYNFPIKINEMKMMRCWHIFTSARKK
jgi:hypothetical protein